MTQPVLQAFKRRGFAIEAEVTEGLDPTPTPSANGFDLFEGSFSSEGDIVERPRDRTFYTNDPFIFGNKRGILEGMLELVPPTVPGHATNGLAPCRHVLYPCGMAQTLSSTYDTTTYTPISDAIPSATIYFWHSGTLKKLLGCRGTLSSLVMAIGDRFKANVKLQGTYDEAYEATLPTDFNLTAFTVPVVARKSNTMMRVTPDAGLPLHLRGKSMSVDMNNTLATKEYTEFGSTGITDRKATATLRFARPAKADFDVYDVRDSGTLVTFDFLTLEDDGVNFTRLFARGQIETINEVDIEGDFGFEVTMRCIATDAGGDEFGILYSGAALQLIGDLPDAAAGAYSQSLQLRGLFVAPVTYSVLSGSLPGGCTLNSATGVVSGTATPGTTTCVIRATAKDLTGATITADSVSQAITIT